MKAALVVVLALVSAGACRQQADHAPFLDLLAGAEMEFEVPAGFRLMHGSDNPLLPYEGAIRSEDGGIEVRYAIRPLQGIELEYVDPHSAAPEPNHIYPLLHQAIVDAVSRNSSGPSAPLSPEALAQYHADWGMMDLLEPDPEFAPGWDDLILIALHGNHRADAYLAILFRGEARSSPALKTALHSLRFAPLDPSDATLPPDPEESR